MSVAVTFTAPPPGLAPHTDFTLEPIGDGQGLFSLRVAADPAVRLFVVEAHRVVADYAPTITDEQVDALELSGPDEAALLLVVRPGDDGIDVNLLAPVVLNRRTGAAAQVILEDQDYPLRARLS